MDFCFAISPAHAQGYTRFYQAVQLLTVDGGQGPRQYRASLLEEVARGDEGRAVVGLWLGLIIGVLVRV